MLRKRIKHLLLDQITDDSVFWNKLNLTHQTKTGINLQVGGNSDWAIFKDIFVDGEYDQAIDLFINNCEPGLPPLVLDLGSNVGYFALRVADRWLERNDLIGFDLIGVEGSPRVFDLLTKRTDQPKIKTQCKFIHGLVGKRAGSATIAETSFYAMNSIVKPVSESGSEVPFVDLTKLIAPDREIDFLKCDIEGAEEMFIENYQDLLKRTKLVVIEIHTDLVSLDRCLSLLASAGLRSLKTPVTGQDVELFARV